MKKLHPNQERLLDILKVNMDNPLTMVELMEEINVSSTSVVHHHITQLEKKGFLKRNPSNARDYQILSEPEKPFTYINQYGLAQCGPKGSFLDGSPIDRVPIASKLFKFPVDEAFMVTAKGDSMEPNIADGDYIIARKSKIAKNGDIVVCVNNEESIIKIFSMNDGQVLLHSSNPNYLPFIASDDFRIEGIVKNIIKNCR